jgi:hypothetical protein
MSEKTDTFNLSNIAEIYPNEKIIETKDGKKHNATSQIINKQLWPQHNPNRLTDETSYLTWLRSFLHTDRVLEHSAKEQRLNAARSAMGLLRTIQEIAEVVSVRSDLDKIMEEAKTIQTKRAFEQQREMEANKTKADREWQTRHTPLNDFSVLFKNRTVYRPKLEEWKQKTNVDTVKDIAEKLMKGESPSTMVLSESDRDAALAWLSVVIQEKQPNQEPQGIGQKIARYLHLT